MITPFCILNLAKRSGKIDHIKSPSLFTTYKWDGKQLAEEIPENGSACVICPGFCPSHCSLNHIALSSQHSQPSVSRKRPQAGGSSKEKKKPHGPSRMDEKTPASNEKTHLRDSTRGVCTRSKPRNRIGVTRQSHAPSHFMQVTLSVSGSTAG